MADAATERDHNSPLVGLSCRIAAIRKPAPLRPNRQKLQLQAEPHFPETTLPKMKLSFPETKSTFHPHEMASCFVNATRPAARERRVWWLLHDLQHEREEFGDCYTTCSTRQKSLVTVYTTCSTREEFGGCYTTCSTREEFGGCYTTCSTRKKRLVAATRPAARERRV